MDAAKCVSQSPPSSLVCLWESQRILFKYITGRYEILSFGKLNQIGVLNYPTIWDAVILSLIMLINHFAHKVLLSAIPRYLIKNYPSLDTKLIPKLTSNTINVFDKFNIVCAIIYVLTIDSNCTIFRRFSIVVEVVKTHSTVSRLVHLSCISGYIYKLLFVSSYQFKERTNAVLVLHHVISIYVYTVSFLLNQ